MRYACKSPPHGPAARFALLLQGQLPVLASDRLRMGAPNVEDFDLYAEIVCSDRGRGMLGPMTRAAQARPPAMTNTSQPASVEIARQRGPLATASHGSNAERPTRNMRAHCLHDTPVFRRPGGFS